jgi:hypothetical protein
MKYLKTFESFELIKEDEGGGLIGLAIGMGVPAVVLTTAFILSVKKHKKENPDKSWKEVIKEVWSSTAKGAHDIKGNIG